MASRSHRPRRPKGRELLSLKDVRLLPFSVFYNVWSTTAAYLLSLTLKRKEKNETVQRGSNTRAEKRR